MGLHWVINRVNGFVGPFQALEDVPIFMRAFMNEVKTNIDDVLDVHHMVVSNLVKNKALMNRVQNDLFLASRWPILVGKRKLNRGVGYILAN